MARLVLTEPGEDVDVGGNVTVIGTTSGGEVITIIRGNIILDASFNTGGDTVRLPDLASAFTVRLQGASAILTGATTSVTIPVGPFGLQVEFDDTTRTLLVDPLTKIVRLGDQTITSSETGVLPVGATEVLVGTESADVINGTDGDDVIDGLGGNDTINGLAGDDFLRGGAGDDIITGGPGDDEIYGGSGNDRITDNEGGYAVLDGGIGDDIITIDNREITSFTLNGGEGNDTIILSLGEVGFALVDAGGGADRVEVISQGFEVSLLLGGGQDTLVIPAGAFEAKAIGTTIVRDFEVGAGGDRVDLSGAIASGLTNYTPGSNPFVTGHLRLAERFGNTFLEVDRDGAGGPDQFQDLINFAGTGKDTLTADNFSGFDPQAGAGAAQIQSARLMAVSEPAQVAAIDTAPPADYLEIASPPLNLWSRYDGHYFIA
nr:calcium-binding protein [uncultured Sphingomonas sp.]